MPLYSLDKVRYSQVSERIRINRNSHQTVPCLIVVVDSYSVLSSLASTGARGKKMWTAL